MAEPEKKLEEKEEEKKLEQKEEEKKVEQKEEEKKVEEQTEEEQTVQENKQNDSDSEVPSKYAQLNEAEGKIVIDTTEKDLSYIQSSKEWEDLKLSFSSILQNLIKATPNLIYNLKQNGFKHPSKIQDSTIKQMIIQKNKSFCLIAQSQNGSGKTLCFLIGIIEQIKIEEEYKSGNEWQPQAIIIVPTNELVNQTQRVLNDILRDNIGIVVSKIDQAGGHILIGTLGGIINKLAKINPKGKKEGKNFQISFEKVKVLAIDEADQLLIGQEDQQNIAKLITKVDQNRHIYLFSATFSNDNLKSIQLNKRKGLSKISLEAEQLTLDNVHQIYMMCREDQKYDKILEIFKTIQTFQTIIFCNTKNFANNLMKYLVQNDLKSCAVLLGGGSMKKPERDLIMNKFIKNEFQVLITTNVLARGIDLRKISLVVQAHLPTQLNNQKLGDCHTYLHRIGRTGRYADEGIALNLIGGENELEVQKGIEKYYKSNIQKFDNLADLPQYLKDCQAANLQKRKKLGEKIQDDDL